MRGGAHTQAEPSSLSPRGVVPFGDLSNATPKTSLLLICHAQGRADTELHLQTPRSSDPDGDLTSPLAAYGVWKGGDPAPCISAGLRSQGASAPVRPAPSVRRGAAISAFCPKMREHRAPLRTLGSANGVSPPLPAFPSPPASPRPPPPRLPCCAHGFRSRLGARLCLARRGASLPRGRSSRNGTGGVSAAVGGREQAGTGLISPPALSSSPSADCRARCKGARGLPGLRSLPKILLRLRGPRAKQARSSLPKKTKTLRRTAGVKLEEGRFLPWAERAALPSLPRNERSRLRRLGHLFGAFLDCAFCLQGCRTQISPCNVSPARRLPSPAASAPISSSGSQARRRR